MENEKNRNALLFFLAAAVVCVVLLYATRRVVTPFFIAFCLAYLLDPWVDRLENLKIPRAPGILLLMVFCFSAFFLAGVFLAPLFRIQVEKMTESVPDYINAIQQWVAPVIERMSAIDPAKTQEILSMGLRQFGELPLKLLTSVTAFVWDSLSGLVNVIFMAINVVIIPVAAFYLLRDFDLIKENLFRLIPPRFKDQTLEVLAEINDTLSKFIRGQLMAATLMAVLYSVGLFIVGTPMSLFLGIMAGYANLVPYLGLVFGFVPAALLTYLHYQEPLPVLGVAALFGIVQILEGMIITPRLVGDQVGLHPVAIMAAVLVGAEFFGVLGILLAVPAAAVVNVLLKRGLARYQRASFYS